MISSEVQRTLVKSPPELWTELSDPESLARHLGELGEIRITRTEPENLVEWEAEGTTGTVEIAPSGWGTRVKLTVARELPATADAEAALDAESDAAAAPDAEVAAADVGPGPDRAALTADAGTELAPAPDAELAPDAGTTEDAGLATEAVPGEPEDEITEPAHEPAEPILRHSEPEDQIAERKPAPATEAARRAAGWPAGGQAPGPAIESDLRAAEAREGAPVEPGGMHEWAAQTIEPDDGDLNDEYAAEEEPAPPKRGFFARLFGRRRAKAAPLDEPEPADDGFDESEGDRTETSDDIEPDLGEPATIVAHDAEDPDASAQEPSQTTAENETEIEPADLAARGTPEPDTAIGPVPAAEPQEGAQTETTALPDAAAQTEAPPAAEEPQPTTPVEDLAAELRAAEEVAAEQVEAVLTAVLDRLGSAHHRPFSRS